MREPVDKQFDPVVSPLFVNAMHEELRQYAPDRAGEPRPCPNCDSTAHRKNGYQNRPKTIARLVTAGGIEDVGVDVQQYECLDCGRSFQSDLSALFYEGCRYAKPVVDLCRFHAVDASPTACERTLRRQYGLQVHRDTIERYADRFGGEADGPAIEIADHRYSLSFLATLFGEGDGDEPHFVIQRSTALW